MKRDAMRDWMVKWLLAVAALHVVVGALLPLLAGSALLDSYHDGIARVFWPEGAPAAALAPARALQAWWMALFGPTVQALGLWMGALVWLAGRLRDARIWLWLGAGLLLWAPQDVVISLRAGCWTHFWADAFALAVMLPPLAWLWRHNRTRAAAPARRAAV